MLDILEAFSHFVSAEDKDRVYALTTLATDIYQSTAGRRASQGLMDISTDCSLSTEFVFRNFAMQRIRSGRLFSTLFYAAARRPMDEAHSRSSWVPDLQLPKRFNIIPTEDAKLRSRTYDFPAMAVCP
jgi:hypothetical protein